MADSIERIADGLTGLAAVIRKHGTCAPAALDVLAARLRALSPAGGDEIKLDVLRIPRSKSLDPITVYFDDRAPGVGRVTIACYGDAWTAAWSAMGERTVRQFIADVDAGYLSGAMLQLCGGNDRHRSYTDRVAAAVIAALAAPPQQEPGETINVNEIDSKSIADPSGQTLAGAGGDGHVAYQLTEPGVRPCISAVIWNDETGKPGKGTHVWLTATSAGTTGEELVSDPYKLPELPRLPDDLLSRISSYGAARSERSSEVDRLFHWEQLISGIKAYAAEYAIDAARRAREVGNG